MFPYNLPISKYSSKILASLENNPSLIITGSTGTGKSTYTPLLLHNNGYKNILVIEPRRIAVKSIYNTLYRIITDTNYNKEMFKETGSSSGDRNVNRSTYKNIDDIKENINNTKNNTPTSTTLGYKMRFDSYNSKNCNIKIVTDGTFLNEVLKSRRGISNPNICINSTNPISNPNIYINTTNPISNPNICINSTNTPTYSVIIIDEVHERSIRTDIIISYLKHINYKGKLILMSATLNTHTFIKYLNCNIITINDICYPIKYIYSESPVSDYIVEAYLKIKDIINDRSSNLVCSKDIISNRDNTNRDSIGNTTNNSNTNINTNTRSDVLVFLPGEDDINELSKMLRRIPSISIIKMHSTLTDTEQSVVYNSSNNIASSLNKCINNPSDNNISSIDPNPPLTLNKCINNPTNNNISSIDPNPTLTLNKCINNPTDNNTPRVILSTNICETSLTIPGIRYVIDCGISKIKVTYNSVNYIGCIISSKLSADQRAGRCNRMGSGVCYRLYTKEMYRSMGDSSSRNKDTNNTTLNTLSTTLTNTTPEIQRCSVIDTLLFLIVNYIDVGKYCYINKPYKDNCKESIRRLLELECIKVNKGYFSSSLEDYRGINDKNSDKGGINSISNEQHPAIDTTNKQHPLNTTNEQHPVINTTNKQHPLITSPLINIPFIPTKYGISLLNYPFDVNTSHFYYLCINNNIHNISILLLSLMSQDSFNFLSKANKYKCYSDISYLIMVMDEYVRVCDEQEVSSNKGDKYEVCREYDLPVKGMDTGYRLYKHLSSKGVRLCRGVNYKNSKQEGVSDKGNKQGGVNNSTNTLHPVSNTTNTLNPFNTSSNNTDTQHPDSVTLHKVFSNAFSYNMSVRQKDGSYVCIRSGSKVYIHPSSACYDKRYKKIVYVDLYGGERIYTRIVSKYYGC